MLSLAIIVKAHFISYINGLFLEKIGLRDIYHLYNVDFLLTVEPENFFTLIVMKINN